MLLEFSDTTVSRLYHQDITISKRQSAQLPSSFASEGFSPSPDEVAEFSSGFIHPSKLSVESGFFSLHHREGT